MPQPQQWVAPRPMPMIPTPSSQFSQGPPPEVLVQRAIAEVMERPSQVCSPLRGWWHLPLVSDAFAAYACVPDGHLL